MTHRRMVVAGGVMLSVGFLAGFAAAQRPVPTETVGQSQELLGSIDLTREIESSAGRTLRLRKLTLQPGGVLGLHDHVGRPAITYFLQGELTYHRDGQPDSVTRAGSGAAEGRATKHWAENTGKVPAIWIAADIVGP